MTIIANLFAGPGSGKSTLAHGLMHEFKSKGVSAEFAHEWIKHPVWQGRTDFSQYYVWAKQQRLIDGLVGKVDIIVTDSPTLLSLVYSPDEPEVFRTLVKVKAALGPKPVNIYVDRNKDYWAAGRYQTEEEARALDRQIHDLLWTATDAPHIHSEDFSVKELALDILSVL